MEKLPDGVVTFVFTDVEGSTRMWEESPDFMMSALEQHDDAIDEAVVAHSGVSVKPRGEGDSRFVVFADPADAVAAAADIQRRLAEVEWATPTTLRVRTSLHSGAADLRMGDYYGTAVNRAARLRSLAHGGQTVMSAITFGLVQDHLPEGASIRDMGEHGLKDLSRPEHVFQLDVAGLEEEFPPLRSLNAIPNNLPTQMTEFVGREAELADAERLLDGTRLLTILGPGGAGKTRLAIQAAADLTARFPDGAFFVGLAGIDSSSEIVQTVAESLGFGLSSDEDPLTQLLAHLASNRQLLVFDNFEHLTDGAEIVADILRAAPRISVVATSRSKLNLSGETVLTLSGLETTWATPHEALQASGALLFVDGARRVRPSFVLEEEDLDGLSEILRLTGGMPLAILLAAAWMDMLSVSEVAEEVSRSLDFLETEFGDMPARQRSVRAVFDYSWELLGEEQRHIFAALAVFRGGFTREAAQQVAGATLRDLQSLAAKALVIPAPERGRYTVHELLRQYAEEKLASDADRYDRALEAHAEFYAALMVTTFELFAQSDQPLMLEIVEHDVDNIRMGWRRYLTTRNAAGARQIVLGLWMLYEFRGWYTSGVSLFGDALEAFDEDSDDEATIVVRALTGALQSWFLALIGQLNDADARAAEAVERLTPSSDLEARWFALQSRAICLTYLGSSAEMIDATDEALRMGARMDSPFWVAGMKTWRSFAALMVGDFDTPKNLLPGSLEVLESLDDHYYTCWNLWVQAIVAAQEDRTDDAIRLYTRQAERAQGVKHLRIATAALEGLGEAYVAAGKFDLAESAFIDSLAAADQVGMVRDTLGLMTKIARVRASTGLSSEAVELLATVVAEPLSAQQFLTEAVPINQTATKALDGIRQDLPEEEFAAAYDRGSARSLDVAVKELRDG